MKIIDVQTSKIIIPLKKPFKTALRTVNNVEDVLVKVITDTGNVGYGEAPPTAVITGDTEGSIIHAIEKYIKNSIIGLDIENLEEIMLRLDNCIVHNYSAKAAVDLAVYDLYGQLYKAPVYKLLGGYRNELNTDITISVNDPETMVKDSLEAIQLGYNTLKIKVGVNPKLDFARIKAIREAVGSDIKLRVDANQAWQPGEAIKILNKMEEQDFMIELVEQPVKAHDIDGLKLVTDNVTIPVLADESVFSPMDAINIIQKKAADLINIKLMKTGGIHNALKICSIAEVYGVECMIGCMLESKISVSAAAHLAAAKKVITKIDLDGPSLCKYDAVEGGPSFDEATIKLSNEPGLGFKKILQ